VEARVKFTPTLLLGADGKPTGYGTMLVAVRACATCQAPMVASPRGADPFTRGWDETFGAQLKAAGWQVASDACVADGGRICDRCKQAGLATFRCDLCGLLRSTSQVQEGFGDPAEYLCVPCFETVPAKRWAEACDALREAHKYDFE